jgi:RecB family exonuclease
MAVELKFDMEIDGVPVTGFIDRIDKIEGDSAEIIDYKSGKRAFDKSDVKKNEQLVLYQIAVEKALGIPVGKLTIYHLPSQTQVSVDAHTKKRIEDLKLKVLEASELIEKGEFAPKKGRFCPCDFAEHCPYYMHLYVIGDKERDRPKMNIQQTIEEYSELKEKEKGQDKIK